MSNTKYAAMPESAPPFVKKTTGQTRRLRLYNIIAVKRDVLFEYLPLMKSKLKITMNRKAIIKLLIRGIPSIIRAIKTEIAANAPRKQTKLSILMSNGNSSWIKNFKKDFLNFLIITIILLEYPFVFFYSSLTLVI